MTAREIGAKISLAYAVKSGGTLSEIAAAEIEPLVALAQDLRREVLKEHDGNGRSHVLAKCSACALLARSDEILGKP